MPVFECPDQSFLVNHLSSGGINDDRALFERADGLFVDQVHRVLVQRYMNAITSSKYDHVV